MLQPPSSMARRILEPPRLRIGDVSERHATWMELFFDLVFVVAVSDVAQHLSDGMTVAGVARFLLLFGPVWWAWIGATFYANRFGTDDLGDRLFLLAQMAAGVGLAINARDAFQETSAGFALSYAAFRYILVARYAWTSRLVPEARAFTLLIARGFGLSATIWAISAVVPTPARFILWGVGLMADFVTPISAGRLQSRLAPHQRHLPERFGLFTIIVLGESIGAVVAGLEGVRWSWLGALTALLGLALAFSFWWVYFEGLDASAVRAALEAGRLAPYEVWIYAHLPLTAAIAAAGMGVRLTILHETDAAMPPAERWLVCSAAGLYFASLGTIYAAKAAAGSRRCTKAEARALWAGASAVLFVGALGTRLTPAGVLALVAAVGTMLVVLDMTSPQALRERPSP